MSSSAQVFIHDSVFFSLDKVDLIRWHFVVLVYERARDAAGYASVSNAVWTSTSLTNVLTAIEGLFTFKLLLLRFGLPSMLSHYRRLVKLTSLDQRSFDEGVIVRVCLSIASKLCVILSVIDTREIVVLESLHVLSLITLVKTYCNAGKVSRDRIKSCDWVVDDSFRLFSNSCGFCFSLGCYWCTILVHYYCGAVVHVDVSLSSFVVQTHVSYSMLAETRLAQIS